MLLKTRQCPHCGRITRRVSRKPIQRFLSIFYPILRVECCGKYHSVLGTKKNRSYDKPISSTVLKRIFFEQNLQDR